VLEGELQRRIQAKLYSDFFNGSLDLLRQAQTPEKFCDPGHQDWSGEIEQAKRLYAVGFSLSSDGLDDPDEVIETKMIIQNWLTEVSINDPCMSAERSHELLTLAREMKLESKASKLNLRLKEINS
jgi:hypothetical protein